jgi:ribosomal protein L16 Arg81 hydroxylase
MITRRALVGAKLTDNWRRWIAENYLLGIAPRSIVKVLIDQGLSPEQADAELTEVRTDPYVGAGEWMAQRLRKLESTLDALQRMRRLDSTNSQVVRCGGISAEQFLAEYYAANRPVVLTDLAARWPAMHAWTPDYLKHAVGDEIIEVMTAREGDAQYEVNPDAHRTSMSFSEYVDLVLGQQATNDFYLVANNHFLDHPGTAALWRDFEPGNSILDATISPGRVFFWFGPEGTVTPLHHDLMNVLLVQVRGTKKVTLIPALESHRVYNEVAVYSRVNAEAPDGEAYPKFTGCTRLTVELRAREALFIPVGWWHHVRAMDKCISLSFTNFSFPNEFEWSLPSIVR